MIQVFTQRGRSDEAKTTLYAAPQTSDGALLYYRKDLVKTPPTTWPVTSRSGTAVHENRFTAFA
ncbi:hypothetical protein IAE22_33260, partial [Bacillus sp. S34]|nr:hypothetical protein [Bacillus sp. S34]